MWCVCVQLYIDQTKKIFDHFICISKWFLSLFVLMFCAYFVFHCFKHVLYWKTSVRVFHNSPVAKLEKCIFFCIFWFSGRDVRDSLVAHSRVSTQVAKKTKKILWKLSSWLISQLASHETPRISFLKSFSWETYFKPLTSSLKPLFQNFYIKTQPIWMFFHSINIYKVILNSFHWFWSLDYVLESLVLLVGISS